MPNPTIKTPESISDEIIAATRQLRLSAVEAFHGSETTRVALESISPALVDLLRLPLDAADKKQVYAKLDRIRRLQELRCQMELGSFSVECKQLAQSIYEKL